MKLQPSKILFVIFFMLLCISVSVAQAQTPQQTLTQYISDLQKNPNDFALRGKIIRHVQGMKQKPTIPREAERFMNRGTAAVKSAKDANDFKDAVAEFEKATLSAPWMANAYYNLGVSQDKAGLYAAAIRSLKLYLLAAPNAPDIRNVGKLIDEIEYRQEKAPKRATEEKRAQQEAAEAKKAREQEDFLRRINGVRYVSPYYLAEFKEEGYGTLDVKDDTITSGNVITRTAMRNEQKDVGVWRRCAVTYKIEGRTLHAFFFMDGRDRPEYAGVISDDGNTITTRGPEGVDVYKRER